MTRFIGRKDELNTLEALYSKNDFQMLVLYGRRRVGKSTLLTEFLRGRPSVFYTAIEDTLEKNLLLFSRRIMENLTDDQGSMSFTTFEDACAFISKRSEQQRIVVVFDEFPHLAEPNPSTLSILQNIIDSDWQHRNIFLIISGSSISFMEKKVLSEKSPLFGRRTAQLQLQPFSYQEAAEFVPDYSAEDKAICYGVTGGIAKYLSLIDPTRNIDDNIVSLYFSRSGYLYEEPRNLLTQEFRNVASYSAVIGAAASGKVRLQDIADESHMSAPMASVLIQNLITTGIVQRRTAITEENNKKKIQYVLSDGMFRFWYRFIPDAIDFIEMGRGQIYYQKYVKPRLDEYMGGIFESMCRSYTLMLSIRGKLNADIMRVGTWWGTNPARREQTDIDVVGIDPMDHTAVLGECKFKNELLDKTVYDSLKDRDGLIDSHYRTVQFLLFSKSGFSDWLLDHCIQNGVLLISLDDLYQTA